MVRRSVVAVAGAAVLLLTGCEELPDDPPAGTPGPDPTGTAPAGAAFDFCGIIDLDAVTEVAEQLGISQRLGAEGQPLVVTSRRVANAGSDAESEICYFGAQLGQRGLDLQAYPARERRTIPSGAEPREELGAGGYFLDAGDGWFTLTAPAADAYLQLSGVFGQTIDAGAAEEGLLRLLAPAIAQVPPGAVLAGLDPGEGCAALTGAVTQALDAPPEFSRHTAVGDSFKCEFTTSATRRSASVDLHRGAAGQWQVDPAFGWRELADLDDAWQDHSGVIVVFAGEDVVRVHMLGIGEAGPVDEQLAAEAVAVLTGS